MAAPVAAAEDPCLERRRNVDLRCGFAERACREADAAEARLHEAQRTYDGHLRAVTQAETALDPNAVRAAKEHAHRTFKAAVRGAVERSQVELAAVAWLDEINRINATLRDLRRRVERERAQALALAPDVERLAASAESSRYTADAAVDACNEARRALVACQESVAVIAGGAAARPIAAAAGAPPASAAHAGAAAAPGDLPRIDLAAPQPQPIVRLLHGDRATMTELVARLAGGDSAARSHCQIQLSDLVDALSAAAIDSAWYEFPAGHPFWSLFDREQGRDVARGLASLGFRYDGLGEFADGRVPAHRDLSLAVGHAGLNPVRIRFWPQRAQAAELFRHVRVDTAGFVAERAPSLTLGETVQLLGRRAEMLADLLNEWGRLRPLLLRGE